MRLNKQLFHNLFQQHAHFYGKSTKYNSSKQIYPAAERNKQPIAGALKAQLDLETSGLKLLEISSGSGQHVAHFAPLFPNITFQPTEFERSLFPSISAYAAECVTGNILPPVYVNLTEHPEEWKEAQFKAGSFDYIYNANLIHISPWECSLGLFQAASVLLKPQGQMFTYGPYAHNGVLTPESNINFDRSLRSRDASWGVRDIKDLEQVAKANGILLKSIQEMPSNNKLLTWLKN